MLFACHMGGKVMMGNTLEIQLCWSIDTNSTTQYKTETQTAFYLIDYNNAGLVFLAFMDSGFVSTSVCFSS